jgi:hypothetical protein
LRLRHQVLGTFRIQGSGHFIAEEKPAVLLSYLHDFLD